MSDRATQNDTSAAPAASGEPRAERLARLRGAWQEAKIVMAGVELGVFDQLAREAADAASLAQRLGCTLRGVAILADALVAAGYLTKHGDRYANAADAAELLVRDRPASQAHAWAHGSQMFRSWARLEEVIRHGQQQIERDKALLTDPLANRNFILAMAEGSRGRIAPLLDRLPLAQARRLCDLGGGPGHLACEAARRHPQLEVVLVDLPLTVAVAREQIAAQGLAGRVTARVCDFYVADELELGGPADLVLISQVLHAEGPDENQALLRKLWPHVAPGGVVAIVENLVDAQRTAPAAGALFAVNMLAGTARGRTYTAAELSRWLAAAGFVPEPALEVAERTWVMLARKPRG